MPYPDLIIAKYVVRSRTRDGGQGITREALKVDREQRLPDRFLCLVSDITITPNNNPSDGVFSVVSSAEVLCGIR
jgi:hypothetical protein